MSRHFIILLLALLAGPAWAQATAAADPAAAAASAPAAAAPAAAASASAPATPPPPPAPLDARVQQLKSELVRLNRDLLVLEEELLFPAGTQVAVFVSMDVGVFFELESVQVKMGNQVVGQHLYTPAEVAALKRGGVQRLWLGNLKSGTHAIDAFFTGRGPKQGEHQRDYKRGTTLSFEKTSEPRYIELRIRDAQGKLQPEFDVKVW
jgi:pyruvate/2-oxoglutarate dehydrogenase complex dihydrolipoamide acyltransferase (E2) component